MHRIFFVVTLGVIVTLSPVLVFDGVADAKGGGGASSGGSSSGSGKGKSGQSGPSNSGSSNNGASAKGAAEQALGASRPLGVPARTQRPPMPDRKRAGRHQGAARANPERAALPTMVQVPRALPEQASAARAVLLRTPPPPGALLERAEATTRRPVQRLPPVRRTSPRTRQVPPVWQLRARWCRAPRSRA